ncbi:hypothetical protein [Jannaschia seohaensis]|nr:hypothetical protein [Jannaschia seohaensis]
MKASHGYDKAHPAIGQWLKWFKAHSDQFEIVERDGTTKVRQRP